MSKYIDGRPSLGDIEETILMTIKELDQTISEIPPESREHIRPILPHLTKLIKNVQFIFDQSGSHNPQPTSLDSQSLLDIETDSLGLHFNLGSDVSDGVKNRFLSLREQLNSIDTQYSLGKISDREFIMMREIYTVKLVELVRQAII